MICMICTHILFDRRQRLTPLAQGGSAGALGRPSAWKRDGGRGLLHVRLVVHVRPVDTGRFREWLYA